VVGATRRAWAAANGRKLEAYIRGYRAGLAFLYEPANRDRSIATLRKNLPQMPQPLAERCYATMVGPNGFERTAKIDMAGVAQVLALRSEYGRPAKRLTDPTRYHDPTFYDATLR
jgi:ABC-type nitrate/sulfonate/bicarbonate transport system substrate-binding protein